MAKQAKNRKLPHPALEGGIELKRRRSWLRRLGVMTLWTVGLLLIAAGVAIWVVTRSWFIIAQVQPELERRLGGPVQVADAGYQGGGHFVFRGVVVRAPGHGGPAGRLAQIERVEIRLNPLRLLKGSDSIKSIRLEGMHLRLSEDARDPGHFNFMALHPDWESASPKDGPTLPPRVEILDIQVELGTHDRGRYERIGTRRFAGEMRPDRAEREWYQFALNEIIEGKAEEDEQALAVTGRWNVTTNEHRFTLEGLTLDDRMYSMCPQIVRDWWDRMKLEGRVRGVEIEWRADAPLSILVDVADVALTIPVETGDIWARYRDGQVEATPSRPRMRVSAGTIKLEGDHLTLDNTGELGSTDIGEDVVGVPFFVRLDIPALPAIDWENRELWFEQALNQAAFDMTFRMDGFTFEAQEGETAPAVDLPKVVAEALERFRMRNWALSTEVVIHRGPPVTNENGETTAREIESQGQAYIHHASCTYVDFPYPLTDVDAFLQFDSKTVKVQYLYGLGSDRTRIRLSGDITLPSDEAAVHLVLTAERVPIDGALRKALKPDQAKVFDALLHEPSRERLAAAGLLIDAEDIENAQVQREATIREMTVLKESIVAAQTSTIEKDVDEPVEGGVTVSESVTADELRMEQLRLELARLDRLILAGPFEAGGRVDLNLNIDREAGRHVPVYITGTMTVREGGMIYELFPYPLSIIGGQFRWERDRIRLMSGENDGGITFVTPGGGLGRVTGEIVFPRDAKRAVPQLAIQVVDDRINDAMLAAIPRGRGEAPRRDNKDNNNENDNALSPAAEILKATGLRGTLDYQGRIEPDESGRVNFDFHAQLLNGSVVPGRAVSSPIGEAGLYWPAGFEVREVTAKLRVSRDTIELEDLVGRHDAGAVTASGRMDLTQSPAEIGVTAQFNDLQIGDYLIDLAPSGGVHRARALWERYQPGGSFDATLQYISDAARDAEIELELIPKRMTATLDGRPVVFTRSEGRLRLRDEQVTFDQLRLALEEDGRAQGELVLSGSYGMIEGGEELEMVGQWLDGDLSSPIIIEAMSLLGGGSEADQLRKLSVAGSFDATFRYESAGAEGSHDYEFSMQPKTARFEVNGSPAEVDLDGGGEILIRPGAITAKNLAGRFGDGRFNLEGNIRTEPRPLEIELLIDYAGQLSTSEVMSLLPDTARTALSAIAFSDGPKSRIRNGRLALRQAEGATSNEWAADFSGVVETDDASFQGGVPFDRVNGTFAIEVSTAPGAQPELSIIADAKSMQTYGCEMTEGVARISLTDSNEIRVDDFRAEMYGGAVWGEAQFGVEQNHHYAATISLAGVGLEDMLNKNNSGEPDKTSRPSAARHSGDMFASVSVQGARGRADAQTGRGFVRIAEGRMANMPFLLGVLQMLEFMPPVSDALDFADIEFYIEGGDAVFDRIVFECPTLQLQGRGSMDLDTMNVDVLFRSRGTVALLDNLIGGLNDQLFGISVTGPLRDPQTRLVPLPGLSEHERDREEEWSDDRWRTVTSAPTD